MTFPFLSGGTSQLRRARPDFPDRGTERWFTAFENGACAGRGMAWRDSALFCTSRAEFCERAIYLGIADGDFLGFHDATIDLMVSYERGIGIIERK